MHNLLQPAFSKTSIRTSFDTKFINVVKNSSMAISHKHIQLTSGFSSQNPFKYLKKDR